MRPGQRRLRIAETVARDGRRSVEALADAFGVSPETIRRDLAALDAAGAVRKVHGGAAPPRLHAEGGFAERMAEDAAGKRALARLLPEIVRPGDTLFIDTGSTTLVAAQALTAVEGLTVVTNSRRVADALDAGGRAAVHLLGGRYRADDGQTVGPVTVEQIGLFQADHALITVAALDAEAGAMDSDFDEAQVARAMIARAAQAVVLASAAKFDRRAAFTVCPLNAIGALVCDGPPPPRLAAALAEAGARVFAASGDAAEQAA